MDAAIADPETSTDRAPYVPCSGCNGFGFLRGPERDVYQPTVEHDVCNGAGIMILRIPANGGEPYYGAPKLR